MVFICYFAILNFVHVELFFVRALRYNSNCAFPPMEKNYCTILIH